ncbi:MAG: hypothetical protein R3298_05250 [Gammaproteobacteria bacterium]|nr:hypothetical protein [Gammaproteobacteria bacterium]
MSETPFQPGDVVLFQGETYQVLAAEATRARVVPFPSEGIEPLDIDFSENGADARRVGHAPLPGPTPCADDGCCPTGGNPVGEDEIKAPD